MPKANARHKYVFPTLPADYSGCTEAVVCIPTEWIPLLAGHIAKLEQGYEWATEADWRQALPVIANLQEQLVSGCLSTGIQTMIDEQRRLYRLIDAVFNGTNYTTSVWGEGISAGGSWDVRAGGTWGGISAGGSWGSTEDGDLAYEPNEDGGQHRLVSPSLPLVPPDYTANPPIAPALRARIERLEHLLDNLFNGRLYLSDAQNPTEEPLDDDRSIRQSSDRLDRIISALDGGDTDAPLDNVLQALRGNTEANSDRNVADLLIELRDRLVETDPHGDSLLEELRKLLV